MKLKWRVFIISFVFFIIGFLTIQALTTSSLVNNDSLDRVCRELYNNDRAVFKNTFLFDDSFTCRIGDTDYRIYKYCRFKINDYYE